MAGIDPIVLVVMALLFGLMLGWFIGSRPVSEAKAQRDAAERKIAQAEQETKHIDAQFRDAIRDLASASERAARVDALDRQVDELRTEREAMQGQLSTLTANSANHDKQMAQLLEAKEALSAQFSEVGAKLLGEAQTKFLQRANERFDQAEEKHEQKIKTLLAPVGERLKSYEDQVTKVEKERQEAYGNLSGLIEQMRAGQERVQTEAARLVNSLRNAPKARGRWGEQQLRNVLETCGLAEHTDFQMEVSKDTEDGRLRPDAIVRVPGGQSLVIDAKVSLNAYQDAFGAEDDDGRNAALAAHCQSMKTHIDGLSRKAYWDQFADAPDYVILFVPGEHFLSAALEHDPALWDHAFEKRVLLATPTNLVAIARTVAAVWRQEGLAREARQIGQLGKELYDRLAVTSEHLKRVGAGLNSAVGNYNKFVGSYERNVLATGRRFAELNIETGKKAIEDVPELDALPRYGAEDHASD